MMAHDPSFPGPAALNRVLTLLADQRNGASDERLAQLTRRDALNRCHAQANCTAVCPMDISPTDSILALRRRAIARLFR
jgi:succinate dehydrogenase/fumarate reductase-like Fe-S protein